jgi:AraC-like DNA-binding protein
MQEYNKILESLVMRFEKAVRSVVTTPIAVENFQDIQNTLFFVHKGVVNYSQKGITHRVDAGDILFIPAGCSLPLLALGDAPSEKISHQDFDASVGKYLRTSSSIIEPLIVSEDANVLETISEQAEQPEETGTVFTWVVFDAKVYDSVNFFKSLDLPAFILKNALSVCSDIANLMIEVESNKIGRERMVANKTDALVLSIFRYIIEHNIFVEKIATNITYFLDPRLMYIFNYIKENLAQDLSNKVLATVANVSEDYVGQYFKMLTGINPQDYIEYQRMEEAVRLLRTSRKSIRAIGQEIGYQDTAYFCRRFKMMFGVPAGKMRRRSNSLMNVKKTTRRRRKKDEQ